MLRHLVSLHASALLSGRPSRLSHQSRRSSGYPLAGHALGWLDCWYSHVSLGEAHSAHAHGARTHDNRPGFGYIVGVFGCLVEVCLVYLSFSLRNRNRVPGNSLYLDCVPRSFRYVLVRFTNTPRFLHSHAPSDHAVSASTTYLVRSLGTVWGVSITSAIVQNTLSVRLPQVLSEVPDKWRVRPFSLVILKAHNW